MYNGLVHLHNVIRWILLLLLVIALFRHMAGLGGKRPITKGDQKTDLFLMISAHVQLVLGLILWFVGPLGLSIFRNNAMGDIMKNAELRFWALEHLVGMLIAVVLITVGRRAVKSSLADTPRHRRAFIFFLIAFIIIMASIPWPGRISGRPLMPGM